MSPSEIPLQQENETYLRADNTTFNDSYVYDGYDYDGVWWTVNDVTRLVYLVGMSLVLPLGLIGNTLCVCVMTRQVNRSISACIYLGLMSVADSLMLLSSIPWIWVFHFTGKKVDISVYAYCGLDYFVFYFSYQYSAWMMVAVTVDRLIRVTSVTMAARMCTAKVARRLALTAAILLAAINAFQFGAYKPVHEEFYSYCVTRQALLYFTSVIWPICDAFIYSYIPSITIVLCNGWILRTMWEARRKIGVATSLDTATSTNECDRKGRRQVVYTGVTGKTTGSQRPLDVSPQNGQLCVSQLLHAETNDAGLPSTSSNTVAFSVSRKEVREGPCATSERIKIVKTKPLFDTPSPHLLGPPRVSSKHVMIKAGTDKTATHRGVSRIFEDSETITTEHEKLAYNVIAPSVILSSASPTNHHILSGNGTDSSNSPEEEGWANNIAVKASPTSSLKHSILCKNLHQTTAMLTTLSLTFVCLTVPIQTFFIVVMFNEVDFTSDPIYAFVDVLFHLNHAVNFYLYCLTAHRFRNQVKQMFNRTAKYFHCLKQ